MDLYKQPYNPTEPVECFDETSKQLIEEVQVPVPAGPGRPAQWVHNLFIFFEPLTSWRHIQATEPRYQPGLCALDVMAG